MTSPQSAEIIVVGAGVLGLSVAAELAARGLRPLVLDPLDRHNASSVAAGMIAPAFEAAMEDASPERAALYRQARDLWPDFAARAGIAIDRGGAAWVGPSEPLAGRMARLGFGVEATSDGFRTPEDWRLDPQRALGALQSFIAAQHGVVRRLWVECIEPVGGGFRLQAEPGEFETKRVVLALGWSASHCPFLGLEAELSAIAPVKGQILRLAGAGGAVREVTRAPGVYLVPRGEDLIVGATMQAGRHDLDIEPEAVASLRRAAAAVAPALGEAEVVEALAGVRGSTPDGLPLAGASRLAGVHLALAPRRNGWLLGPLVARAVAASVLGEMDPSGGAFAPDRFG